MSIAKIIHQRNKFGWLLISCVSLLLVPTAFPKSIFTDVLFLTLFTLSILIASYTLSSSRKELKKYSAISVLTIGLPWIWYLGGFPKEWRVQVQLPFVIFYTMVVVRIILFMLRQHKVTPDLIFGAMSGYFMLGFIFSILMNLIFSISPSSYNLGDNADLADFFYYSFITLSTLGYGDILPMNDFTRSFAVVVTVSGQFYMATIVALLIGKFLSTKS